MPVKINNMEYYVEIELAKLANKNGFNEQTDMLFDLDKETMTNKWCINKLPCPTVSQLNNWLRQKLNINIYVRIFGSKWAAYVEEVPSGIEITPRKTELAEYDCFETCLYQTIYDVLSEFDFSNRNLK